MFKNYLKIALKHFIRHKGYSFINIFGLSVGIASFILIFLYVWNEMSYDNFHKDVDRIYRIYEINKTPNGESILAQTPDPLPTVLKNDYPEIGNIARLFCNQESWVTVNRNSFKEDIYFTDPSFFEIFNFPLSKGDSKTALENVNSVVLTEELAKKYFGNDEPIGKVISYHNQDFVVTGILKNLPPNTGIKFNILMPAKVRNIFEPDFEKKWWSSGTYTFVKLSDQFTPEMLEKQFPFIIQKYFPDFLKGRVKFGIQPLQNMHLESEMEGEIVPTNSKTFLYILVLIGLSIILIASINFMNLSAARYSVRAQEIGMRKTFGATKKQIIFQFLGESIVFCFLSLLVGIVLVELFLPEFNNLVGKQFTLNYTNNIIIIPALIGFGFLLGIFSGIYPAVFLSSCQPIHTLKKLAIPKNGRIGLRRGLVIIQYTISIVLIISELIIIKQVGFMKNKHLGFDPSNIVVVPTQSIEMSNFDSKINAFINKVQSREDRNIISTTISENVPGYFYGNKFGVIPEGTEDGRNLEMIVTSIDDKYLETYKLNLKEGRNFSKEFSTDINSSVLINETAAKKLGWTTATDKSFNFKHGEGPYTVVGVVEDNNYKSLQTAIEPLIYRHVKNINRQYISIKLNQENVQSTLSYLEKEWKNIITDVPFEYFFSSEKINSNYGKEERTAEIMGCFTLIAIILSSLGLSGLTSILISQRTKEIGIRKVLGGSMSKIVYLLSKEFTKWIIISNIFAWPIAYYLTGDWLQNFSYKIDINVIYFISAGMITLIIAISTIGYQTVKAALMNPVDALRSE